MQAGATYSLFGYTITTAELLVAWAALLTIATVMLFFSRRKKITLQRSAVTDELMLHLSRLGDELERQAMRPLQTVITEHAKRVEAPPAQAATEQPHSVAYSMFGR